MGPNDNSIFILLCLPLVLLMQLGFAMLEAGLVESRHTISVLFKNVMDLCIGVIAYVFVGAFIQFAPDYHFVLAAWGVEAPTTGTGHLIKHPTAVLAYNAVFAATAATIISGTLAGRARIGPYLVLSTTITLLVYPVVARVIWGSWGSFGNPFHDMAGSVVVHTVGGMAAFGAALALRPRSDPSPKPHSMPLVVIGTLVLWFGWYGFNLGSIGEPVGTPAGVSVAARVALNTTLAGAAGGAFTWFFQSIGWKDKSLPEVLNGILGGLVLVTASADLLAPWWPLVLGLLAAVIVSYWPEYAAGRRFLGIGAIDAPVGGTPVHPRPGSEPILPSGIIDDPVGAIPVHGFCGMAGGIVAAIAAAIATSSWQPVVWQIPAVFIVAFVSMVVGYQFVKHMNRTERLWLRFQVDRRLERGGLDNGLLHASAYRMDADPNTIPYLVEQLQYLGRTGPDFTYGTAVWPGRIRAHGPAADCFKYRFFRWSRDAWSDARRAALKVPTVEEEGMLVQVRDLVEDRFSALDNFVAAAAGADFKTAFDEAHGAVCSLLDDLAKWLTARQTDWQALPEQVIQLQRELNELKNWKQVQERRDRARKGGLPPPKEAERRVAPDTDRENGRDGPPG